MSCPSFHLSPSRPRWFWWMESNADLHAGGANCFALVATHVNNHLSNVIEVSCKKKQIKKLPISIFIYLSMPFLPFLFDILYPSGSPMTPAIFL